MTSKEERRQERRNLPGTALLAWAKAKIAQREEVICWNCRREIDARAERCSNCGTAVVPF